MKCVAVLLALAGAASACPVAGQFTTVTTGAVVVQPAVAVVATVPAVQIVTPAVQTVAVAAPVVQTVVATPVVQTVAVATPVVVQQRVVVQQQVVRRANVYGGAGFGGGGGFFGQIRSNAAQGAASGGLLGAAERVVGVGDGSGQFLQGALIGRFLPGGGGFRFKR